MNGILRAAAFFLAATLLSVAPCFAWGDRGHIIINTLAAQSLPRSLPAFLRRPDAQFDMTELGFALDRMKGAGRAWDSEYDPGHYIDVNDDGTVAGTVLGALPLNQEQYDTALRAAKTDQYREGYLPYAMLEGWEQVRDDFAWWRVDNYRASSAKTAQLRADAARDRALDEADVIHDIGIWSHYVGDASQPLHVSVHFNGWGNYPNPAGYTSSYRADLHSKFETDFVNKHVTMSAVRSALSAPSVPPSTTLADDKTAMAVFTDYIRGTLSQVIPLYDLDKTGAFDNATPQSIAFATGRLAYGASHLRDFVTWAWDDSLNLQIGYPYESVRDILSGKPPPPRTPGD